MKSSTCVALVVLSLIFSLPASYAELLAPEAGSCALLRILDTKQNCENIQIQFDLSLCNDTAPVSNPLVDCMSPNEALATIRTQENTYVAQLQRDGQLWRSLGPVKKITGVYLTHRRQKRPEKAPEPSDLRVPEKKKSVELSAHLDMAYSYHFTNPGPLSSPNTATAAGLLAPSPNSNLRQYDSFHNQFGLNLASLTAKHQTRETEFNLAMGFGQLIEANHRNAPGAIDEVTKHIPEAYLRYSPESVKGFSLSFGKQYTYLGLSHQLPRDNQHYSMLFSDTLGAPTWMMGLSASYSWLENRLISSLHLTNGWNRLYDNNHGKTLGLSLDWDPSSTMTTHFSTYVGPENDHDDSHYRLLMTASAHWKTRRDITLRIGGLYGNSVHELIGSIYRSAKWAGIMVGGDYQPIAWNLLSFRVEKLWDEDGFATGNSQNLSQVCLTSAFYPSDLMEFRVELRHDHSTQAAFTSDSGLKEKRFSVTAALLYTL